MGPAAGAACAVIMLVALVSYDAARPRLVSRTGDGSDSVRNIGSAWPARGSLRHAPAQRCSACLAFLFPLFVGLWADGLSTPVGNGAAPPDRKVLATTVHPDSSDLPGRRVAAGSDAGSLLRFSGGGPGAQSAWGRASSVRRSMRSFGRAASLGHLGATLLLLALWLASRASSLLTGLSPGSTVMDTDRCAPHHWSGVERLARRAWWKPRVRMARAGGRPARRRVERSRKADTASSGKKTAEEVAEASSRRSCRASRPGQRVEPRNRQMPRSSRPASGR